MAKKPDTFGTEKARGTFCIIPQRAVHDTRLQHRPKTMLCFLALANYSNRAGVCYPNQATIAKDLNITQSTVSRHIKLLMEYGYVRYATKKFNKSLSYRSNAYFIVYQEDITEQDAIAIQNAKDHESLNEPLTIPEGPKSVDKPTNKKPRMQSERIPDMQSEYISNRDINIKYKDISKNVMNEYKKLLEQTYGHVIIWRQQDQEVVEAWLHKGHSPEFILKRIKSNLEYRKRQGLDSVKRITYYDKQFMTSSQPKDNAETLQQLLNKFTATHKIKW